MLFDPRTPVLLAALAALPASATAREDLSTPAGEPTGQRVEGRVLDESGQPLAGARVVARRRRDEPTPEGTNPRHARSDKTGRFHFSDLEPGTWDVDVDGPGHATARIGVRLAPDGPPPAPFEVRLCERPRRAPAAEHGVAPSDAAGPATPPPSAATAAEALPGVDSDDPVPPPADAFTAADAGVPSDEPAAQQGDEARPGADSDPAPLLAGAFTAADAAGPAAPPPDEPAAGSAAPDGAAAGRTTDPRAEARRALDAGRVLQARSLVATLEGERPEDADLFYAVGEALLRAGETQDAVTLLEGAVARDPAHAEARYRRALGLLGLGRRFEARDEFERVLELRPEGPLAEGARTALAELAGDGSAE